MRLEHGVDLLVRDAEKRGFGGEAFEAEVQGVQQARIS